MFVRKSKYEHLLQIYNEKNSRCHELRGYFEENKLLNHRISLLEKQLADKQLRDPKGRFASKPKFMTAKQFSEIRGSDA